jgi:MFS family permease
MSRTTTTTSLELSSLELRPVELDQKLSRHTVDSEGRQDGGTAEGPLRKGHESSNSSIVGSADSISKWKATIIIGTIAFISFINSMLGGILVVSLPTMAKELNLSGNLLLWPASVNSLASGCTLILSGSIADIVGGRKIYLLGEFFLVMTTIACGLSRTGIELILFRAAQGVAISFCLPSSVLLITKTIPDGSYRNIAFASLGAGQPFGFSVGLVIGGVFVGSVGWRYGYYIGAILTFVIFIISIFGIPYDDKSQPIRIMLRRMGSEIDWIGCALISTSLGMFSYVFSVLASGGSHFLAPASISLFSIAVILIPIFIFYLRRQERLGRKVLFSSAIWSNRVFTTLCITVFLMWGVFEAIQYFLTLFFQSVQSLSAIQTSIRFLPMVITGGITNLLTGWLVKRVRADILILGSAAIASISPLLMAIISPEWPYWTCAFFAVACAPICADVLFTVASLLITSVFPPETHGLAGAVFNTISNIGNSVGLAITAVVASSVTISKRGNSESTPQMLMDGYRATFWLCFGIDLFILVVVAFGLRKIGKVGIKVE